MNSILFTLLFVFIFSACEKINIPTEVNDQMAQLPDEIDYNFKVKQILSDKCFACHGPSQAKFNMLKKYTISLLTPDVIQWFSVTLIDVLHCYEKNELYSFYFTFCVYFFRL